MAAALQHVWQILSVLSVKEFSGYYLACSRCKRKTRRTESIVGESCYQCPKCLFPAYHITDVKDTAAKTPPRWYQWRYYIAMTVTNGHWCAEVVVFGDCLNSVLGVSVTELHQFLVSFSEDIFGRPHFDHAEVPGVLHSALEQLLVGRFFKFLMQIPAMGRTHVVKPSNGYADIAKILPLQYNSDSSIVSILKDQYLGPSASRHGNSLDSALHKHISPLDSVSDSFDQLGGSCTDETSLIEVQSFCSYDMESRNSTEQDTSRSSDSQIGSPSDTSTSCGRVVTDTTATQESTSGMLVLLCDLLSQGSPLATTPNSGSSLLFARTSCCDEQARERSAGESPQAWCDSELAFELALQHEVVQELEAEWLPISSVGVVSTSPGAHESPKELQSPIPLRDREVTTSCSVSNAISSASISDGKEANDHFSDSISEMDILEEIVSEWESTQKTQRSSTKPVNNSQPTSRNQTIISSPSRFTESSLHSPFILDHSQPASANNAASPDLFSAHSSVTSLGSYTQLSPDLFSSCLFDPPPPSISLTNSASNTSQATLQPSKLTFSVPTSSSPHITTPLSKVQTPLSHFRRFTNSQVRQTQRVFVSTPLHRYTSSHSKPKRQRTKIIKFAGTPPLTGYSTPSNSKQNDSKSTAEKACYNTSTPLSSQQLLPEFSPDIL